VTQNEPKGLNQEGKRKRKQAGKVPREWIQKKNNIIIIMLMMNSVNNITYNKAMIV